MIDLLKIIGTGFIGGMLALSIRKQKPEFSILVTLITAAIILGVIADDVGGIVNSLRDAARRCGVDIKYFEIIIKVVGVSYIAQFASEILRDSGENSIASKVEAAGKISILVLVMPVMMSFLELCVKVVNSV